MSAGLGSLVLEIGANVARWAEDAGKMAAIAEANGRRMEAAFNLAGRALKGIVAEEVVRRSFEFLAEGINKSVEASAGLVLLAERTGASVENLSALAAVAKLSGTESDVYASALTKLAKSMADAGDGGAKTTAAFNAIGISVKDLEGKNPDQVFLKIAQQLHNFADGTGKVVVAQELLGKGGAAALPVLKDLGDAGAYIATTTTEQSEAAEQYEKNLRRLTIAHDALWRTVSTQLVPVFNAFAKALLETATSANGVKGVIDELSAQDEIRSWAEDAAKAVAFVVDAFDGVIRVAKIAGKSIGGFEAARSLLLTGDLAGARAVIAALGEDVDHILMKAQFSERLARQIEASHGKQTLDRNPFEGPRQIDTAGITGKGAKDITAALEKAKYEGALKAGQDFIAAENQQFTARDAALKALYDEDQVSISYYFGERQAAITAHADAVVAAYGREIDAARVYAASLEGPNAEVGREQVKTKVLELQAKSLLVVSEAEAKSAANTAEAAKATDRYADSVTQLSITLARMRGDLAGADALEEALYKKQLARTIRPGDTQGAAIAAGLEQTKAYDNRIAEQQRLLSIYDAREATAEARIALQERNGAIGGFQALAALGKARQAEVVQLEEIYQKELQLATALPKDSPEAMAAADQLDVLRLKIDQLKAAADPLGKAFSDTFETSFVSNLDKVIHQTESVGDAFKNMGRDILQMILQIEEKNFAMSLFGSGSGGTSPWVSAIAGFFGGGYGGGHAGGGPVSGGTSYLVGERGPELFRPHSDGTIVPNHALGGAAPAPVNVHVINLHDPSEIPTMFASGELDQHIVNVVARNPSTIKTLLR